MALREEMASRDKAHKLEVARFRETLEAQQKENETTMTALAAKNSELEAAREEMKPLQDFKSRARPLMKFLADTPGQDEEPVSSVSNKRVRRE